MEVLYACCCGLDVHKKSITACVLWAEPKGKVRKEKRRFGTFTEELLSLAQWLQECGVTHVAMESTGVYWKPVWNILEGEFEMVLVNAQHIKAVPGRKTDQKDSEWIADLLQHGLLRGSFVPPRETRELRDLTRYRVSLTEECNRIANRIQKVLEDANIKLASVATDALGASGRAMIHGIIDGEQNPGLLADMAKGLLRNKLDELHAALAGRITPHHRFMLAQLMDDLRHAEAKMERVEEEIKRRTFPFGDDVARLCTIPGIDRVTAWGLLAELGQNMDQFPSAGHAASWAVSTKKSSYLSALFRRIAARRGNKRAILAVAHAMLVIAYYLLKRKKEYKELGVNYFDQLNAEGLRRSLVRRLERLGHQVILQPRTVSS